MMTKRENQQIEMHLITIEDLVPTGHFLRKVNAIIDFSFIYDEVEDMYCYNNGRPSINPAVLIKFLLIGFLYGVNSEKRIPEEIQVNMAYRWFLGLDITDKVPDHSTISQNRRRRSNSSGLFWDIFQKIVFLCVKKGLADGKLVFTDSAHIKANASRKTEYIKQTEEATNEYPKELDQYEETVRSQLESEGKAKPARCRKRKEKIETVHRRVSSTGPESGFYKRKGKAEGMHCLSHGTVDTKNGIIIDVAATAGNVNDIQPYIERLDYIEEMIGLTECKGCPFRYRCIGGRRGLEAAEQQCPLSSTALNLKRMIKSMA